MKNIETVVEITEEILQSTLSTPKKQKRIKSSTFWRKFGIERRSKEKIEIVKKALEESNIFFESDEEIGTEAMDKMVKLSYLEPELAEVLQKATENCLDQDDSWIEPLENRVFASEREVEQYFIAPILKKLDYDDEDCAIGFRLVIHKGVKKEKKEVDFAVFDGSSREKDKALIVIEAKSSERKLTDDATGQARSYAVELSTPYYIVTNGNQIIVFLFRGGLVGDTQIMNFTRQELREKWQELYKILCKSSVIRTKKKIKEIMNLL